MRRPPCPPITDELVIALRAFAELASVQPKGSTRRRRKAFRLRSPATTVVFDTETTSDHAQALRFGTYQVRDGAELRQAGIFYDPSGVTSDELAALNEYAQKNGQRLITKAEFVESIFYGIGYDEHANIVGLNLPFDISRLALSHASARGKMRGGFTFKLSPHEWTKPNRARPRIQIKHINSRSSFIQFASGGQPQTGAGQRKKQPAPTRRGHIIDLRTLAAALFARSFSLASLGKHLEVAHPKFDFQDFRGPITAEMIGYAVRDVQTSWECFEALRERFDGLGLKETGANRIYSEASIGKAYFRDMGIRPWVKVQPDLPRGLLGIIMSAYYGGRSEVRIRRELRQVILCDFLSMYPTVCILMRLWRFVIAEGMSWRDSTEETRALLNQTGLAELQSKAFWPQLATLVRVKPEGDIFPVRADYALTGATNIGVNHLTNGWGQWFTLADCIASKLLTGRPPEVLEAIAFAPGSIQEGLTPTNISGKGEFRVDPVKDDFFARVITLRQQTKAAMKAAVGEAKRTALDTEQFALKIAANATSYGIFLEVNIEEESRPRPVTVFCGTGETFEFCSKKVETPGPFFHPLLGVLITGAARLMLAITETLVNEAKLEWAFCDTDSMAIAKPLDVSVSDFYERVQAIVDWFAALNPHGAGSILKIEDVNYAIGGGELVPLHVWAVSAKRYALFNISDDGQPIIRKASAHGLGHWRAPYGSDNPAPAIPAPHESLTNIGVEHWHHDLWWQIVKAALNGRPDQVRLDYHPALASPAVSRYAATSPGQLRWFKKFNQGREQRDQVRPFNFMLAPSAASATRDEIIYPEGKRARRKRNRVKPIAPFDTDHRRALALAFDRETGEPVSADQLRTYAEALAQYHLHPEAKFLNGDYLDRGTTVRRRVRVTATRHIGKEALDWERQAVLGRDEDAQPDYGFSDAELKHMQEELSALLERVGFAQTADGFGISSGRLKVFAEGGRADRTAAMVSSRLAEVTGVAKENETKREKQLEQLRQRVSNGGLRATARELGVDPSNLRRRIGASHRAR